VNGFAPENHDNACKTSKRNRDLRSRAESLAWFHRYLSSPVHGGLWKHYFRL
jgi:hypothetical protein